jgi:hypothetical protein
MWGLIWGLWQHATNELYKIRYNDLGEPTGIVYDKLGGRRHPETKLWLRPGWGDLDFNRDYYWDVFGGGLVFYGGLFFEDVWI